MSEGSTSRLCPRLTWTGLHTTGLGLLFFSGAWSPLEYEDNVEFLFIDVIVLCTVCCYAASSLMDPGYLPIPDATKSSAALSNPLLDLPPCTHCKAQQVPRAKHCHDCGRCVRRLDHHCWWLGNCVGIGNHRTFVAYLTFQALLLFTVGVQAAVGLASSAAAAAAPWPPLASGAGITCIAMCSVLGLLSLTLLLFQCSLMSRGETTYEHLRRDRINEQMGLEPHVRPYDRGALRNCVYFWCGGNLPPTRVAPPATSIQAPPGALNYVQPPFGEVSPKKIEKKFSEPPFGL